MHTKYLEIIKTPIVTEKSSNDQNNYNKFQKILIKIYTNTII